MLTDPKRVDEVPDVRSEMMIVSGTEEMQDVM